VGHGVTNEQLGNGEGTAQKVETHPTDTLASSDKSAMNSWRSSQNFPSTHSDEEGSVPLPKGVVQPAVLDCDLEATLGCQRL
jgi:hypothetical protein